MQYGLRLAGEVHLLVVQPVQDEAAAARQRRHQRDVRLRVDRRRQVEVQPWKHLYHTTINNFNTHKNIVEKKI